MSINIYGSLSIFSIALIPNNSYTFFANSAPIPNLSKNPTICHTSQFSIKLSDISNAFSFDIPLISASLSGSLLNICIVSSPNFLIILLANASPIPFTFPFAKYFSNAPNVCGINFSKVSTLNCLPYFLCSTKFPINFKLSPLPTNGR